MWHLEDAEPSHHQVPNSCTGLGDGESEKTSHNLATENFSELEVQDQCEGNNLVITQDSM